MTLQFIELLKEKTIQTVTLLFRNYTSPILVYHNLEHTQTVVQRTGQIAAHYELDANTQFILHVASWFHDTGYLFVVPPLHEEKSAQLARDFLSSQAEVSPLLIAQVEQCIMATKMPQCPHSLPEKILCDADLYHFGTDEFSRIDNLVKQETLLSGKAIDGWDASSLKLLKTHKFNTTYCQKFLAEGKANNIALLADSSN
ncbi:HD domain-containing protein [Spirosoma jeollabukense]